MKKIRIAQTLMIATILLIVAFQAFYLTRLYNNEWKDLKKETDVLFRETVYKLQVASLKKDTTFLRTLQTDNVFNVQAVNVLKNTKQKSKQVKTTETDSAGAAKKMIITYPPGLEGRLPEHVRARVESLAAIPQGRFRIITSTTEETGEHVKVFAQTIKDSIITKDSLFNNRVFTEGYKTDIDASPSRIFIPVKKKDSSGLKAKKPVSQLVDSNKLLRVTSNFSDDADVQIFTKSSAINDSIPLQQLDSAYKKDLKKASIQLGFKLSKNSGIRAPLIPTQKEFKTNPASVGFLSPFHYQATFDNPFNYLIRKIAPNILLSLLLVAFTTISFVVLYRNLMSQRRLADIKNDFISNITHELKTPIATVNVAIEAMKNFNVLNDTKRTKEYLDISSSELQRLSLLVDKVLKLSMFEKKSIELKKEWFNIEQLVEEVMNSMRLQFEKCKAEVTLNVTGNNPDIKADRLHITSVVYNLLDNALKYSKEQPVINIDIISHAEYIELKVKDNGIGIGSEFQSKIFEQFFRVPSGDRHNIKGYGLGLSYVSHIVKSHHGFIEMESDLGKGSTFTIKLPYDEARIIRFDKGRSIRKEV